LRRPFSQKESDVEITALRPQSGEYGRVAPGETIDVSKTLGDKLLSGPCWAKPQDAKKHFAAAAKKRAAIAKATAQRAVAKADNQG
jgi:hypothetical protein